MTTGATIGPAGSGPALADDPGNQALALDGTLGNRVQTSLTSGVSTSGSIVGWIKLAQLPSIAGRIFYVAGESRVSNDLDVQVQTDDRLYFFTDSGGSVRSAPLSANTWTFFAATFTASNNRNLYIDGALVATNTPGSHFDSGTAFTIGYSTVFTGRTFMGNIDEVAFYNTNLSAAQVAAIYDARTVVPEPGSVTLIGLLGLVLLRRRGK